LYQTSLNVASLKEAVWTVVQPSLQVKRGHGLPVLWASFLPVFNLLRPSILNLRSGTGQIVSESGSMSPSTHYESFQRPVFPVTHLHWYWQSNKNNQATEHTNYNGNSGPI